MKQGVWMKVVHDMYRICYLLFDDFSHDDIQTKAAQAVSIFVVDAYYRSQVRITLSFVHIKQNYRQN